MIKYIKKIFNLDNDYKVSIKIYRKLTQLSRNLKFYQNCQIPDTIDGRFEALSIILFLFFKRINNIKQLEKINQNIANIVIADLDQSIREMGVGDMGIIKRIKNMGKSMWGRFYVYNQHYKDDKKFKEALIKNVYRTENDEIGEKNIEELYSLIKKIETILNNISVEKIQKGDFDVNL